MNVHRPNPIRKDGYWWVNFKRPRRCRRRFSDRACGSREAARDEAEAFIKRVWAGDSPASDQESLSDSVNSYLAWAERTRKKRLSTIKSDRQRLSVFSDWARASRLRCAANVTIGALRAFQDHFYANYPFYADGRRRQCDNPGATWEKYRLIVSAFLNWCVERNLTDTNPLRQRKEFVAKVQEAEMRWFNESELKAIFAYFDEIGDPVKAAWFRLLAGTGLRLNEAWNLRWRSLDLRNGVINVTGDTKSYRNRTVPISDTLMPCLRKIRNGARDHYVFGDGKGGRFCHHRTWYQYLQQALKACDIEPAGLHAFRHTFGSHLIMANVNLKVVQLLMGHRDVKTTEKYVHLTASYIKESTNKLPY